MAFLTLGGNTVPAALGETTHREIPVGKVEDAFDGTPRSSVRGYENEWTVSTRWLTASEWSTLETDLKGTPPVAATGTLTGSINVLVVGEIATERNKFADGERVRATFTIREE